MNETGSAGEVLAPTLRQLAALGVEGTITGAARASGTSQPTLSRAVRWWEAELQLPLVVRRGRGVDLTAEGAYLASAAAEALRVLDAALDRLRGTPTPPALTVGFVRSLGPVVVGELVASFLADHPDVVVGHREDSTSGLLDGLDDRSIDVAVTAPRPPARYGWLPLGQQSFVLMLPRTHPLAKEDSIRLEQLRGEPFLALDRRFHTRQVADRLCAAAGVTARVVVEADDLFTVTNYVAAGLGVAIMPFASTPSPRTVELPISDDGARREFGLAWPLDEDPSAAVFVEHARRLSTRYPKWADLIA